MSGIKIVDVDIDLDFLFHWFTYTFDNHPKLTYLENLIYESKKLLNQFFNQKSTDSEELKKFKKLMKNVLMNKMEGYNNWYQMKNMITEIKENEEKYKEIMTQVRKNPLLTIEQFCQLLEEKVKEQVTVEYVDKIVNVLMEESKKLKDMNNVGELTYKFNNIVLSYLNSMANIITKYNSLDITPENLDSVMKKIEDELFSYNKSIHETIPTGYPTLDKHVYNGGFQKSRLYLIQGKTGFGKSVFLVNLTKNFIKQGKSVLFFTLENTLEETRNRLISCISGVRMEDLIFNNEKKKEQIRLTKDFFDKYKGKLYMEHISTYSLTREMVDVFVKIKTSQGNPPPDIIIIDYLDLMKYPQKTESERIRLGKLTQELKKLSQDHNCVVISPTQLNRDQYKRKNIDLDSISESSMKSHFSDSILILSGDTELLKQNKVELQVRKNRHGKTHIKILFDVDFDRMLFEDTGQYGYDLESIGDDLVDNNEDDISLW